MMKLDRLIITVIGATLGTLFAVWWVRKNGFPALPASTRSELTAETPAWIQLD